MARPGTNERTGQPLAVVIGAGGLGMAVARRLANAHRVLLADRDAAHLERQVAALRSEGHDASGVVCDVLDPAAVESLAVAARAAGPVKALAHVVGLSPTMADAPTILRVNLIGPTLAANAFIQLAGAGTAAVFIASLAAHLVPCEPTVLAALDDPLAPDFVEKVERAFGGELVPGLAYPLSKAGLIRMCQRKAAAWGARGARILSLSPVLINTPMEAIEFESQPAMHEMLELTPLRREGTMVEIADAVEFLVSDRASYISGTDLLIDGGLAAAIRHAV